MKTNGLYKPKKIVNQNNFFSSSKKEHCHFSETPNKGMQAYVNIL